MDWLELYFLVNVREFRERGIQDQLQIASALNILINAISVWNTVYLSKVTKEFRKMMYLKEELLPHISPLGREHINFLGEYKLIQIDYQLIH